MRQREIHDEGAMSQTAVAPFGTTDGVLWSRWVQTVALTWAPTAGIRAGIRHLNTFSGNEQDRKAGPVLVGFCGVRHDDITELEVSWCRGVRLHKTRRAPQKVVVEKPRSEREKKGALDLREKWKSGVDGRLGGHTRAEDGPSRREPK